MKNALPTAAFSVGQQVVAFASLGVPCRCNPGPQGCRVTITKVGRTKVYGVMSGSDKPRAMSVSFDDPRGLTARPIPEARGEYYAALTGRGNPHPRAEELVRGL